MLHSPVQLPHSCLGHPRLRHGLPREGEEDGRPSAEVVIRINAFSVPPSTLDAYHGAPRTLTRTPRGIIGLAVFWV